MWTHKHTETNAPSSGVISPLLSPSSPPLLKCPLVVNSRTSTHHPQPIKCYRLHCLDYKLFMTSANTPPPSPFSCVVNLLHAHSRYAISQEVATAGTTVLQQLVPLYYNSWYHCTTAILRACTGYTNALEQRVQSTNQRGITKCVLITALIQTQ